MLIRAARPEDNRRARLARLHCQCRSSADEPHGECRVVAAGVNPANAEPSARDTVVMGLGAPGTRVETETEACVGGAGRRWGRAVVRDESGEMHRWMARERRVRGSNFKGHVRELKPRELESNRQTARFPPRRRRLGSASLLDGDGLEPSRRPRRRPRHAPWSPLAQACAAAMPLHYLLHREGRHECPLRGPVAGAPARLRLRVPPPSGPPNPRARRRVGEPRLPPGAPDPAHRHVRPRAPVPRRRLGVLRATAARRRIRAAMELAHPRIHSGRPAPPRRSVLPQDVEPPRRAAPGRTHSPLRCQVLRRARRGCPRPPRAPHGTGDRARP